MRSSVVLGIDAHVPARQISNDDIDNLFQRELSPFLEKKRGIFNRHWLLENECTSDIIMPAAERALASAGIRAVDLSLIIVATDTPDYVSPCTAAVIQHRLGARNAGVFDINAACAGFVTALDIASRYGQDQQNYRYVLVIGAYGISKFFNPADYKVVSVFADGAGAIVLGQSPHAKRGILVSELHAFGEYHDHMGIYAGGTKEPVTAETLQNQHHKLTFRKRIPTETNPQMWPDLLLRMCKRAEVQMTEIKRFFFTQINLESIEQSMNRLDRPRELAHLVMDRYGYTGSACLPMALADAVQQKLLHEGDLIALVGSGGGMALAGMLMVW